MRIRPPIPVIGRDAELTIEIIELVRAREKRKLLRRAFWKGFLSMFTVDGWKERVKQRKLIINLHSTQQYNEQ